MWESIFVLYPFMQLVPTISTGFMQYSLILSSYKSYHGHNLLHVIVCLLFSVRQGKVES